MRPVLAITVLAAAVSACGADEPDAVVPPVVVNRVEVDGCGLVPEIATGISGRTADGFVVTVAHALGGTGPITVDGRPAAVQFLDLRSDVAVLTTAGAFPDPPDNLPAFGRAAVGDAVTVVLLSDGEPHPVEAVVRSVAPIRFNDLVTDTTVVRDGLVLSVPIVGGDSGAPVVARDGRVVGMMFANARNLDESYAIAASEIEALLAAPPATTAARPPC